MSTQTENIRGLYSGDAYTGKEQTRSDNQVNIDVEVSGINGITAVFSNTFPAADYGKNPTINLQTGRVLYRTNDAAIGANSYAIDISHVYNSKCSRFASRIFPSIGKGWKLNLQQAIVEGLVRVSNALPQRIWQYIDADGNVHEYKLFDSANSRYYATDDATNVLTESSTEYVLEDALGNKLIFIKRKINRITVGLLSKSISCQNASVVKHYEYDSKNRLVKVYDERKNVNGRIKSFIELKYDVVSGLLSTVTAYDNFSKKISEVRYEYINSDLVAVYAVAFNKSHVEVMTKKITKFTYSNGKLLSVEDCDTKSAMEFVYDENNRIKYANYGVVVDDATDQDKSLFVCKKSQQYKFYSISNEDSHVFKTELFTHVGVGSQRAFGTCLNGDILQKEEIAYAYFLNRSGEIVSKFETQDENRFLTLGGENGRLGFFMNNLVANNTINGYNVSSGTSIKKTSLNFELPRNAIEKESTLYEMRFNLRQFENCTRLKVKYKTVVATNEGEEQIDEKFAWIDGTATNCWLPVSLQFYLPNCPDNGTLYLKEVEITVCKNDTPIAFQWDYLRFSPSVMSLILFQRGESFNILNDPLYRLENYTEFLGIGSSKTVLFDDTTRFLTEADIQKTYSLAKRSGGSFDIIYNSGKCRDCGFTSLQAKHVRIPSGENLMGKTLSQLSQASKGIILQKCVFEKDKIRVVNVGIPDLSIETTSEIALDYVGNMLYSVDEYGVRTEYKYDAYGNISEKRLISADGVVATTNKYYYDENDNLLQEQHSGNKIGIVTYNDFDLPCESEQYWVDGVKSAISTKIATDYTPFNDKVARIMEYEGNKIIRQNTISYQNGRACTVTDGTITNNMVHDYVNDVVEYTESYPQQTLLLRRDEILPSANDTVYKTTMRLDSGSTATFTRKTDKYNHVTSATDTGDSSRAFRYIYYHGVKGSMLAKKVKTVTNDNSADLCKRVYSFDADDNVVGWTDTNASHEMKVLQVSNGRTKYTFDNAEDYFSEVVYDSSVTQSPRVVRTAVLYETEQNYDRPNELDAYTRNYTYDKLGNVVKAYSGNKDEVTTILYEYANTNGEIRPVGLDYRFVAEDKGESGFHEAEFNYINKCSYSKGRISGHSEEWSGCTGSNRPSDISFPSKCNYSYSYDAYGRLTAESSAWGSRTFSYADGRLYEVSDANGTKRCTYTNGRLKYLGNTRFVYDNYGNRINDNAGNSYEYSHGNVLVYANGVRYRYNHEGVRIAKIAANGNETRYFVDGNKILGEDRNGTKLRYFYDANGICGFSIAGHKYGLVKNLMGNIAAIVQASGPFKAFVAMYTYDAWGKCTVRDNNGNEITDKSSPALINPFRWKSLYLDEETGLYYANGSFYDPKTALYVDAADISTVVDRALGGYSLDRTTLLCNNTLELEGLPHGIFTVTELVPDPTYDPNKGIPWYIAAWEWVVDTVHKIATWYKNIPRWLKVAIGLVFLAAAVVITILTEGSFLAAIPVLVQFAVGVAFGVVVSAVTGLLAGTGDLSEAVLDALADGIFWGGVFAFISSGVNAIKSAGRTGSACAGSECFREGTLVATADGLKPIEDIEVGDKVLAYDQHTGKQAYKKVTRLFRNKTDKWYHVHINEQDIVCTAGHPFYVADLETFVSAKDLKVGQSVLLADGTCAVIEEIRVQKLRAPETTYNFEVEDYHTYYVSDDKVLVHNLCKVDAVIKETINGKGNITSKYTLTADEALEAGRKFLGDGYVEIGKSGSGVFKAGNRIFRIDYSSLNGFHKPFKPHFHLEILNEAGKRIVNNHIILII